MGSAFQPNFSGIPQPTESLGPPAPDSILGVLEQQFEARADELAVVSSEETWTYRELDRLTEAVAFELERAGIEPGDFVAIHAVRTAWVVPAMLGVWRAGGAFVMADASHPAASLTCRLGQLPLRACLDVASAVDPLLTAFLSERAVSRLAVRSLTPKWERKHRRRQRGDEVAYIAFTSGSTGTPRGVVGTHGPVAHFLHWHMRRFALGHQDRFAMLSGLGHDPLLRDVLTPLVTGARLFVPEEATLRDGRALAEWMHSGAITVAHLTPTLAQILTMGAEVLPAPLDSMRYFFFGGEALTRKLADRCLAAAPRSAAVNFYGATETPQAMGHCVYDPNEDLAGGLVPVGHGIDDVQLLVITPDGRLARVGEAGEICVRTPHLAAGYWHDEAATARRFVANPFSGHTMDRIYRTGDVGCYLEGGRVTLTGRSDNQLKIAGYRIEPGEIEVVLERHPSVRQALVMAIAGSHGKELAAFCVAEKGGDVTAQELRSWTARCLPTYMTPGRILVLAAFPMTRNGKVDREALSGLPAASGEQRREEAFGSEVERVLARLLAEALDVEWVGPSDDFFELGGTSLGAAMLVAAIEQRLGARVPISMLLDAPTPARLARALDGGDFSQNWKPLVRISEGELEHTALFCVHAVAGTILTYRALAQELKPHPVFALQAAGLDGLTEPDQSIPEMAKRYVNEIRHLQPNGPYYLCGFSAGGLIALEMAQQMLEAGQVVEELILFDSRIVANDRLPAMLVRKAVWNARAFMGLRGEARAEFLRTKWVNTRRNLDLCLEVIHRRNRQSQRVVASVPGRVETSIRLAEMNYHPIAYGGRVTLFRTHKGAAADPVGLEKSWSVIAQGGLDVVEAEGNHEEMLLPRHIRAIGARVRAILEENHREPSADGSCRAQSPKQFL